MKAKFFLLILAVVLILAGCDNKKAAQTSDARNTIVASPPADSTMMIIANLLIKPEKIKDFVEAARVMIENSNKEPGCRFYKLFQDPYENTKFVFVEEYKNQAAVNEHFAAEYFKAFGPKIADFVAEPGKIKIVTVAKVVNQ